MSETTTTEGAYLRIGELARRSGVSPELLRAWERRYGLLQPSRSAGGFRLYTDDDERRIRRMSALLAGGLSAAEAARQAIAEPSGVVLPSGGLASLVDALVDALLSYDETRSNETLDGALASFGTRTVLSELAVPVLREIGEGWEAGHVTVGQEHFASNWLRGRLLGLARGWGRGVGPLALLACPGEEQHDLPLIILGIGLRASGWRIALLGAATPTDTIGRAAEALEPRIVVLSASLEAHLRAVEGEVASLAAVRPVAIGGPAASEEAAGRCGAMLLQDDLDSAVDQLTPLLRP
jgi:DNA-binding transcriptional MerR regulator